ncbi:MAG: hypothetical protein K0S61_930 [Anaerocolumna sp.]|nr:hypothetical protein [Anaerocolumna sp.]
MPEKIVELSEIQKGIYFECQTGGKNVYNISAAIKIKNHIDIMKLEQAVKKLIEEQAVLRSHIEITNDSLIMVVKDEVENTIVFYDISKENNRKTKLDGIVKEEMKYEFDLLKGPLSRVALIATEEEEYILVINIHHIISDGVSLDIFIDKLFTLYTKILKNEKIEIKVDYGFLNFVETENKKLADGNYEKQKQYWKEKVKTYTALEFPKDFSSARDNYGIGKEKAFPISKELMLKIEKTSQKVEVTPFIFCLSAFSMLMGRYCHEKEVTVSSPFTHRPGFNYDRTIGCYIYTLPLMCSIDEEEPFTKIVSGMYEEMIGAYKNIGYPNNLIAREGTFGANIGMPSIFDISFVYDRFESLGWEGIQCEVYGCEDITFPGNMMVILSKMQEGDSIKLQYKPDIYAEEMIDMLGKRFVKLLNIVTDDTNIPVKDINLLLDNEREQILCDFNQTTYFEYKPSHIMGVFHEKVLNYKAHTALIYDGGSMTYEEVNKKANQLAHKILLYKKKDNDVIGVQLNRSKEMVIAILGILKAGCAYVPIEDYYPQTRKQYIIQDADITILITTNNLNYDFCEGNIIFADDSQVYTGDDCNPNISRHSYDLAYIEYTSGSTGEPKGVMIENHSVVNTIMDLEMRFPVTETDVYLYKTPFSFDISGTELYGWFAGKGALCILEPEGEKDPELILSYIEKYSITHINFVPSMFRLFLELFQEKKNTDKLKTLKWIFIGGEAVTPDIIEKFFSLGLHAKLENVYGPTECTMWASNYSIKGCEDVSNVSIGHPLNEIRWFVVDENHNLQMIGVPGELVLSGVGLARGYLNKEELTKEKFCDNPFYNKEKDPIWFKKMYKTGDLARWLPDGSIEFLGRIDFQVKIGGVRIELGEIENALSQYESIVKAVVVVKQSKVPVLCAYYLAANEISSTELREYLSKHVPSFMIPSFFVRIDELPLNSSGKIDRKVLIGDTTYKKYSHKKFQAPESELENIVAQIYKEVLEIDQVGIDDNFFEIGGHSLAAIQVHNKLKQKFDKEFSVTILFQFPTIRLLSEYLIKNEKVTIKDRKQYFTNKKKAIDTDIAIIGMAINVPGANSIEGFWNNLKNEKESIYFYADEELRDLRISEDTIQNTHYVKAKGRVEDIETFDPEFFEYTPGEVNRMSPQLRLLYKGTWEALEDAGYYPHSTKDKMGIFIGGSDDFEWYNKALGNNVNYSDMYQAFTMSTNHFLAARLAYKFNIKGPVFSTLTGCSTTLVTTHLACQSLMMGECDIAIAGGVTVELPNDGGYMYQDGMMFSADGHCRPFDARANGTVFSNGLGIVVLKRLEEAVAAGDHIYAVIKGSAINNDGSQKGGFAAPSVEGQAEVIEEAYKRAEVDPETVSYIEAHGTGTILGDPIEVESLTKAFATDKKGYCVLGSLKGNIGHTDTAAGITGLIKVALSLNNKFIPGTVNYKTSNPKIQFEETPFVVHGSGKEWKRENQMPLRAGINSFGVGGTNAHMVLEEAPGVRESSKERKTNLLLFSGKTEGALIKNMTATLKHISAKENMNRSDVAWTLMTGRKHFKYRKAVVINEDFGRDFDVEEFLEEVAQGSNKIANEKNKVYFMFSGQGSQYQGMGRDLYEASDSFIGRRYRLYVDKIFSYLEEEERREFFQVIYGESDSSRIDQTRYSQFALFVTEYTLANILLELGVKPAAFIGHSIGEVTAAAVAGVWSLEDTVRIIRARGDMMQKQNPGVMLAIMTEALEVEKILIEGVSLALVNTSDRCVVGGTKEKIVEFEKIVKDKGFKATVLKTSHAFHTSMMRQAAKEFGVFLKDIKMQNPVIPIVSNVTGEWVEENEMNTPEYWVNHIISPVNFNKDLEAILEDENGLFIETGAGRSLCTFAIQHRDRKEGQTFLNILRHAREKENDLRYLYTRIGLVWCAGIELDWQKLMSDEVRNKISLPVYHFEKKSFPIKLLPESNHSGNNHEKLETVCLTQEKDTVTLNNIEAIEEGMIKVFSSVLGFDAIAKDQDFFELGGDSLKAVSLSNEIERSIGIKIAVSEIFKYTTPKKMAAFVNTLGNGLVKKNKIIPVAKAPYYKTSPAQRRMYSLYQLDKTSTAYNLPSATIIEGKLNEEKVREVAKKLLMRHEILRTSFELKDYQVVQLVADQVQMELSFTEQTIASDEQMVALIEEFVKPFDLSKAPLCRLKLVTISDDKSVLLFDVHHIIADGTSMEILTRDFNDLYISSLKPLELQYKDFAEWQNHYLLSEEVRELKNYWTSRFADSIPVLTLPFDRERPVVKTFSGNRLYFSIDSELLIKLEQFAVKNGATMYMTLLSAWYVLLGRYSGQEDIVIGSPVAGRQTEEISETMGMFVNMLAMRNKPEAEKRFIDFFHEVKNNTIDALKFQNYQFDDLVEQLSVKRELNRNALFDVCFDYQNMDTYDLDIEGMKIKPFQFNTHTSAYDMVLTCQQNKTKEIECFIDYATDLFNEDTIERIISNYLTILESILKDSETIIGKLNLLCVSEKEHILQQFKNTKLDINDKVMLHEMFEANVEKFPDNTALITSDGREFTYSQINRKANFIAHKLLSKGIDQNALVGIMTKRNENLLAGILGILKAGAAYVPIDLEFPKERINYMIQTSGPKAILIDGGYEDTLEYEGIYIDCSALGESDNNLSNPKVSGSTNSLAYVIFTSGTTGKPKGVMVNHSSVINFIHDIITRNIFRNKEDRVISITTLSFDIFAFESIVPMCTGHSIYMADEMEQLDSALAAEKIIKYQVTHILSTVSRIKAFIDNAAFGAALGQLKCILSGGENYPVQMLKDIRVKSKARIYNMYGPTETTIWSTSKDLTNAESINIGEPIANTQIFIINNDKKLQPYGVYGEICIAGEGLARGYYNDNIETDKKFVSIEELPDTKLYKTGDRGRLNANGEVEITGRFDDQIKIRGYRIELVEIEKAALEHPSIASAVVKVFEDMNSNKNLSLFYCLKGGDSETLAQNSAWLKEWLRSKLPHYMLPSEFVQLDKMPTLPNGKVNKNALNIIKTEKTVSVQVPPKSVLEKEILNIWREILQKDNIGVRDNFFDAGGNSFALMMVNNKINNELGLSVPVMKLFEYPTIEGFVHLLTEENSGNLSSLEFNQDEEDFDHNEFDDDSFEDDSFNDAINEVAISAVKVSEKSSSEDVAVIGMACRFPDAENIEIFWENILNGRESIQFFEDEDLINSGIPRELFEKENYIRAKGYLEGAEYFDSKLFDYSDKEAQMMDPQIRMLHQCTYEVLENAGYNSYEYEGKIALYAGSGSNLLWMTKFSNSQNDIIEAFEAMTYNEKDFLTTRIAYKLNLKGPILNIQTACSTSLVAIHQAAKLVISGEADMAVAGGVCISYPRKEGYLWHEGMIFSKDGHCRPFSKDSGGTVPGNGCGVVLLKTLKKALEDKDHIYAVIKGSAVNNDGIDKIGYTAPSIKGQCEVIKTALKNSRTEPEEICFMEAHGTATSLGDPIEVEALKQAWNTKKKGYCALGAVKANLGHLDAAAGVAGFIKTVLVLDKKEIPPMINFNQPNEMLDLSNSPFYINTEIKKLYKHQEKLKAAVSSFGIGGTNAHIILEEAPPQ